VIARKWFYWLKLAIYSHSQLIFRFSKKSKLFGEQPDIVEQSNQVKIASKVIDERIPGASKMDDLTINSNIEKQIGTISKELAPEMKAVELSASKVDEMNGVWDKLKKKQSNKPEFVNNSGSGKVQEGFETFLDEMRKPFKDSGTGQFRQKTLDDLWDIRQRYDDSISETVKQASNASPEFKQLQKEMWLENRQIMNDVINDTADGLGEVSQKAFSDMTSLYTARQNIIGKVKLATKGKPGVLSKENLFKGVIWYGGIKVFEKVTGVDVPVL